MQFRICLALLLEEAEFLLGGGLLELGLQREGCANAKRDDGGDDQDLLVHYLLLVSELNEFKFLFIAEALDQCLVEFGGFYPPASSPTISVGGAPNVELQRWRELSGL